MKRLLIYFAGIGDLVILVPLFRRLAESGELDLLGRGYGKPLFKGQSFIANTYALAHPNRGRTGLTRLLMGRHRLELGEQLAMRGYDEVIVFGQERKVITDWVNDWKGGATVKVMTYPEQAPQRLKTGLESLGIASEGMETSPRLDISEEERTEARGRLRRLGDRVLGVQPGSGPVNVWLRRRPNLKGLTPEQWAWLITDILEADDADAVVFHGSAKESRDISSIVDLVPEKHRNKLHDWTGKVGIHDLKAVLAESYAFLSVDTGPAHMAAAVGCPLLVFFGASDPDAYLMKGAGSVELVLGSADCQYCLGTAQFKKCNDNICMKAITRDMLNDGWRRLKVNAKL
jgi:ADP-heptose:LPS heptosyltransferase